MPSPHPLLRSSTAWPHVQAAINDLKAGSIEFDAWVEKWFPENTGGGLHPVPYLSGAWHHAREAVADLKEKAAPQEGGAKRPVVAKPEPKAGTIAEDALTHSGFPGRPSKGKHLIDDEFERRVAAGQGLPSLADEAKALLDWYKKQHPKLARPTTKTIKENIRARHRQWKASRPEGAPIRRKPPEIIESW